MILRDDAICTPFRLAANDQATVRVGDIVQVRGYGINNELGLRHLAPVSISVIGHRPLLQPMDIDSPQLAAGSFNHQYVRMRGVVAAAFRDELDSRWNWFLLRTPSGSVNVACPEELIASGHSNKDIARILDIGINCVKYHLKVIFANLGASTRAEATSIALSRGLILKP